VGIFGQFAHVTDEIVPVLFIIYDLTLLDASDDHLVERSRCIGACFSGHGSFTKKDKVNVY
jgi:hypothetical protein